MSDTRKQRPNVFGATRRRHGVNLVRMSAVAAALLWFGVQADTDRGRVILLTLAAFQVALCAVASVSFARRDDA